MSSLVILFIAMIALIVPLNNVVDSAPSSALNVDKILELVQQQQRNAVVNKPRRQQLRKDPSDSDSDSDSDSTDYFSYIDDTSDSDNNRYAKLNRERIIDLIDKVANEKSNRLQDEGLNIHRKGRPNFRQNNIVSRSEKYSNSQANSNVHTQLLEQLLSRGINEEDRKKKARVAYPKKRLVPNRLTGSISRNDIKNYKNEDAAGLEDYSKVYIVLNPQAVRKSKNKNSLNDLISKVLALSSPTSKNERQGKKKPRRYKGFLVKDGTISRRSRRESKEMYAPRDSMADDYSPKRSRNVGNTGGRTAIPYIRHRGDIYERDN